MGNMGTVAPGDPIAISHQLNKIIIVRMGSSIELSEIDSG